ncbi:hypothetical protein VTK26DRAFT_1847 [Humicola hyalothermophila]
MWLLVGLAGWPSASPLYPMMTSRWVSGFRDGGPESVFSANHVVSVDGCVSLAKLNSGVLLLEPRGLHARSTRNTKRVSDRVRSRVGSSREVVTEYRRFLCRCAVGVTSTVRHAAVGPECLNDQGSKLRLSIVGSKTSRCGCVKLRLADAVFPFRK